MAQSKRPTVMRAFKSAMNQHDPSQYADCLARAMAEAGFGPYAALLEPLLAENAHTLVQLPHKSPATDLNRDSRLVAWFQACEDQGASVQRILPSLAKANPKVPTAAMRALARIQAPNALRWWQARGVGAALSWPDAPEVPIDFSTLAMLEGNAALARQFNEPISPACLDKLWTHVWTSRDLHRLPEWAAFLEEKGPIPGHALEGLARAGVNKRNIDAVMKVANRLANQGVPPLAANGKPSLARALDWFRSPSTLQLVEFFLVHGADPLQPYHNGPEAGSILQAALEKWLRTPQSSQLRPWFRQAFERITHHTSAEVFLEMFPHPALERLSQQYPTEFPHFQQMVMERKTAQAPSTRTHKVRL